MSRQILLLDVTAMSGDAVCVAGLDVRSRTCVRLARPSPSRHVVKQLDMRPGDLVEIDWQAARGPEKPHVEDGVWAPPSLRKKRHYNNDEIVKLLGDDCSRGVEDAFGPPWRTTDKGNHAWRPGTGARSLATLRAKSVRVYDRGTEMRVAFTDGAGKEWTGVPFQDLATKMHREACADCMRDPITALAAEFDGDDVLIRVGLTRPFASGDGEPACWLQVTNIFARERSHFA